MTPCDLHGLTKTTTVERVTLTAVRTQIKASAPVTTYYDDNGRIVFAIIDPDINAEKEKHQTPFYELKLTP